MWGDRDDSKIKGFPIEATRSLTSRSRIGLQRLIIYTYSIPPSPRLTPRSRSMVDRVRQEIIAALFETSTINTGAILYGSFLIVDIMDILPSFFQSVMDRSKRKKDLIANKTEASIWVFIAKDLQPSEKDGTLDLIKNASGSRRHRSKTFVVIEAIKLLDGLRSLPSTLEKDGSTTEDLERETSFVAVEIHEESDRHVAKSSTDVRRENINTSTKNGTFNSRHPPLKTTFNRTHGKKIDNDDRIEAHQIRISEFFSLLERNGATGTPSLVNTELAKIYFLDIYKKCKCFLIYFFVLIYFGCNGLWNVFFVLRGGN